MKLPKFKLTGPNIANAIGAAIVLYLLVVLGETVHHNYVLGRQVDELRAQIATLEDQKQQLAYSIQYYNTDSFRDREARSKLGLQQPGENVVIIPRPTPTPVPQNAGQTTKKPSNFHQWLDFLSGKLNS